MNAAGTTIAKIAAKRLKPGMPVFRTKVSRIKQAVGGITTSTILTSANLISECYITFKIENSPIDESTPLTMKYTNLNQIDVAAIPAFSYLAMALYSKRGAIKRIVKVMKMEKVINLPYPDLLMVLSDSLLYNPSPTPEAIDPIVFNKITMKSKFEVETGRPGLTS